MKVTKRRIRNAFQNATPNVLSAVLSKTGTENAARMETKKKPFNRIKEFLATAAAVVLLFCVGYAAAGILSFEGGSQLGSTPNDHSEPYIGKESAQTIALEDLYSIELRDILSVTDIRTKLVKVDDNAYYDVVLQFEETVYDYDVNAYTGIIENIRVDKERAGSMTSSYLSWQTARDAALKHAGLSMESLTALQIEFDLGECIYNITFRDQVFTYEYEIDGYNGKVLMLSTCEDDDRDPVLTEYESRQSSIEFALECAGVSYDALSYLASNSRYDTIPKTRNIYFEADEIVYFYELRMENNSIISSEQSAADTTIVTSQVALKSALSQIELSLYVVSDLSFEQKDTYGQISSEKFPVYVVSFTAYRDKYEVIVDALSGAVLRINRKENAQQDNGSDIALPYFCANAALEDAGISKEELMYLSTEFKNNGKYYVVKFKTSERSFTYTVDGKTKVILSSAQPVFIGEPDKQIGSENAIKLALEHLGIDRSDVMYENVELEIYNGTTHYKVTFSYEGFIYNCRVHMVSGEVYGWGKTQLEQTEAKYYLLLDEESIAIRKAFLNTFVSVNERGNYTVDDLSVRYYGEYSGANVLFVDGILIYETAFTSENVGGIAFHYPTSQHLLVYYEDQFMTLGEGYEKGILEYSDLVLLSHNYVAT